MTAAGVRALAAGYLAIAQWLNRQPDHDLEGQQDNQDKDLAPAEADLRSVAATERHFDHWLIAIAFPPGTKPIVRLSCHLNQARAPLT